MDSESTRKMIIEWLNSPEGKASYQRMVNIDYIRACFDQSLDFAREPEAPDQEGET